MLWRIFGGVSFDYEYHQADCSSVKSNSTLSAARFTAACMLVSSIKKAQ